MPKTLNATAAATMSPEQFDRHRAQEVARRSEFASQFPTLNADIERAIIANRPGGVATEEIIIPIGSGRNDEEDEKLQEVQKVHRRMSEVGTLAATVVNMLPWPVQASGIHLMYDDMRIPACPIDQPYILKVISIYKVDLEDKGGRFGADVVTPIAMANDIVRQMQPMKRGGMFQYVGDHRPGENPNPVKREWELKQMDLMKRMMVKHFRIKYREAEAYYQQNNRRGLMNIVDEHRLSTQWLLYHRLLTTQPTWLTATREEADVPDSCSSCGQETGAGFGCSNCGYILNPMAAFLAEEIEDDHQSLRRLTREQLDELGLNYVQTSAEYRAMRRQQASGSGPAPSPKRSQKAKPQPKKKGKAKSDEDPDEPEVAEKTEE